jgi:hypothetical protein
MPVPRYIMLGTVGPGGSLECPRMINTERDHHTNVLKSLRRASLVGSHLSSKWVPLGRTSASSNKFMNYTGTKIGVRELEIWPKKEDT